MLIFSHTDFVKIGTGGKSSEVMPFHMAFSNLVKFDTGAPERIVSVLKKGTLFQKYPCRFTTHSLVKYACMRICEAAAAAAYACMRRIHACAYAATEWQDVCTDMLTFRD